VIQQQAALLPFFPEKNNLSFNETPRRKQRGILLDYNFFFVASDGEFNP
jgi:hypothetical protein